MTIAAVILAAGLSHRMGELKQLLPWKNGTILGSTIDLYIGSPVDKTIVVVGYCAEKIIDLLKDKPVEWVVNQEYESGMASSLRAGIKNLGPEVQACLLGLGDTPLIKSETVAKIVEAYRQFGKEIVIPCYKGRKGHPVLMTRRFFPELLNVQGDLGARTVIQTHQSVVYRLETDDEGVIIDLDTPASYQIYYQKCGR